MKIYDNEWWDKLEAGKIELAGAFGPNATVMSQMAARQMVMEALQNTKEAADGQGGLE